MADKYKIYHPVKYYRDYLNHNIRPDGRELDKFRPIAINIGSITTADGSAIVKLGNTTIVCGIRAELAKPKSNEPESGYLVPSIELPPICAQKYRLSSTTEDSEVFTSVLSDILVNSGCVDLNQLCITKEKLVWSLFCDLICIDYDGCVVDVALIATIAALKNLTLPKVEYDDEIDKITVDNKIRNKLDIKSCPISTTFIVFDDNVIITDPTREEEDLSSALVTVAVCNSEVCFVLKPGGTPLSDKEVENCIKQAISREQEILKLM